MFIYLRRADPPRGHATRRIHMIIQARLTSLRRAATRVLINRAIAIGRTDRMDAQTPADIGVANRPAFLIQYRDGIDQVYHKLTSSLD